MNFKSQTCLPGLPDQAASSSSSSSSLPDTELLLITANVGSMFENENHIWLVPVWIKEIFDLIQAKKSRLVGIHCQEVGSKAIESNVESGIVRSFVSQVSKAAAQFGFDRTLVFFDENFAPEMFTALGSIYLVHRSLISVQIYDFQANHFRAVDRSRTHIGPLEQIGCIDKYKFPLHFFPDERWSRKGYLRSRWQLGSTIFDLINIHLFHDVCNVQAVTQDTNQSVYVEFRRKALQHTIDRIQADAVPYFIFGDFNFRLDGKKVLDVLTNELQFHCVLLDEDDPASASTNGSLINHSQDQRQQLLTIGKKEFRLHGVDDLHDATFGSGWSRWTRLDVETHRFRTWLCEFPLNFPPTYPYEENQDKGSEYSTTRCPAWCDRVLMSHDAKMLVLSGQRPPSTNGTGSSSLSHPATAARFQYDIIGSQVCLGDHKPVFLSFSIPSDLDYVATKKEDVLLPSLESPSYTDLMNGVDDEPQAEVSQMFRETTV